MVSRVIDFSDKLTLPGLLKHWAELAPDAPFLVWAPHDETGRTYSWSQTLCLAGWGVQFLKAYSIGRGDRFCVHARNRPETLALLFAAATVGATIIPTNTRLTSRELEYLASHSGARLVVTEGPLEATVRNALADNTVAQIAVLGDHVSDELAESAPLDSGFDGDNNLDVAVLYTSGTTANPKGVRISQAALINAGHSIATGVGFTAQDRNLAALPLFHVNSLCYTIMTALVTGGSVALNDRFSATRYFEEANRSGATFGWLAATPMRMLLAQPGCRFPERVTMRKVVFGQNITPDEFRQWQERFGIALQQIYGMTETVTLPLMSTPFHAHQPNAVGRAAPGTLARLVTEEGREANPGEAGELWLGLRPMRQMMSGYLFDEKATAAAFDGEWFRTGDFMRITDDGLFFFIDRKRDVLKVSGENVSASEVEMVLNSHPAIFDSAAVGAHDELRDQTIKAYVIFHEGSAAPAVEIIEWCRTRLASFKVPTEIVVRKDFPRTSAGKIQKNLLHVQGSED